MEDFGTLFCYHALRHTLIRDWGNPGTCLVRPMLEVSKKMLPFGHSAPNRASSRLLRPAVLTFRLSGIFLLPLLVAAPTEAQRSVPILRRPSAASGQPRAIRRSKDQIGFTNPFNGQLGADVSGGFSWAAIPEAHLYRLNVGTRPGGTDLVDSGEIGETTLRVQELPEEETLYAALWAKGVGSFELFQEIAFSLRRSAAILTLPRHGQTEYDVSGGFRWAPPVIGASRYSLEVGSKLGGADLLSTGPISETSSPAVALPSGQLLYARLWTEREGTWQYRDAVFTSGPGPAFELLQPFGTGLREIRGGQPFVWRQFDLADAYRLEIGSRPGSKDLHDSGPIQSTRRFTEALPRGRTLYGRLSRLQQGAWIPFDFSFQVQFRDDPVTGIDAAFAELARVREMADAPGLVLERSLLYRYSRGSSAGCVGYANTLMALIEDVNAGLQSRRLDTCLNSNNYDCHSLVEIFDPVQQRWLLADPTFGLTVRLSDGRWATANDISNATKNFSWNALTFQFLGPRGDTLARAYYIDYPLLFLNLSPTYDPWERVLSPLPYYEQIAGWPEEAGLYAVQAPGVSTVELKRDGAVFQVRTGVDGLSPIFFWGSVSATPATPAGIRFYRPRRFLF